MQIVESLIWIQLLPWTSYLQLYTCRGLPTNLADTICKWPTIAFHTYIPLLTSHWSLEVIPQSVWMVPRTLLWPLDLSAGAYLLVWHVSTPPLVLYPRRQQQQNLSVCLSSFEAELDGLTNLLKKLYSLRNILKEIFPHFHDQGKISCDNLALVNYVNGDSGILRGVRHIAIRQEFNKQKIIEGNLVQHVPGVSIPSDKITKLGNTAEH